MIKIITQEIPFEKNLSVSFVKLSPYLLYSNIRRINKSNLNFIEPYSVIIKGITFLIIKGITFLIFNYSTDIYVGNLANKIQISELESYLNNMN